MQTTPRHRLTQYFQEQEAIRRATIARLYATTAKRRVNWECPVIHEPNLLTSLAKKVFTVPVLLGAVAIAIGWRCLGGSKHEEMFDNF